MREIDRSKPVLVTGGSGYIASWVVKRLLDEGTHVRATVRDPSNDEKTGHLHSLAESSRGSLELFRADLMEEGSFDEAMRGCEAVFHTASPFFLAGIKSSEEELIRPAQDGTRNVLESANRTESVRRVVVTSSVASIYGDAIDIEGVEGGIFTEKNWNTTSNAHHQPYSFSKTVAERTAWEIAGKQDRWDLLTINPAWVLGPSLSKRVDSESNNAMVRFGDGTYRSGVPEFIFGVVDVRDVATAHVRAAFTPEASGRHIIANDVASLFDMVKILRLKFGKGYPFPLMQVPKPLFWLMAPVFGFTRKFVTRNTGIPLRFDNSYGRSDLGMEYLPLETTVCDHFQQILDHGLLG